MTQPGLLEPNSSYSLPFLEFWGAYPRHVGKAAAWRAFQKLHVTVHDLEVMLEALAWQARQPAWRDQGGRFVPHASSWLNGRRWEDEPFEATERPRTLGPQYQGWECPHEPECDQRHYCELKLAKAAQQIQDLAR